MIAFRSKMDVKSVDDVFAEINARQIAALMMHDQMADYFDFLGLSGYKRLPVPVFRGEQGTPGRGTLLHQPPR